ncbi:hypothetical protein Ait01nite_030370 [Actinoplanes italicus]|uniref:Uncharacterized protein n=1 Tax=Actinoplanes italicus TaxID=113567 RepID=A0A2T0KJK1_9ACTN|nr:VVA0879 family protein [Actinoplanes italicus]PRX23496.1 hypothetical protein CLV67_103244 [Actinoplanes italicus]GIE29992.1 hypothetical protein Ait01nite_030370 [Actinoplanes italicus]
MTNLDARLKHVRITQADLVTEARLRFGDDTMAIAFQCPHCDDIATFGEFRDLGADPGRCGQECIGRHSGALDAKYKTQKYKGRGCNWAAYGLFRGPWEIVIPAENTGHAEKSVWGFPLAGEPAPDGPVARYLAEKAEATR